MPYARYSWSTSNINSAALPTVSVVVLTFNARAFVARCLHALATQDYGDFEVLVVDNASTDRTVEFVREQFPAVQVIACDQTADYGAGNKMGAARARVEVLAFFNPDSPPQPGRLNRLSAP